MRARGGAVSRRGPALPPCHESESSLPGTARRKRTRGARVRLRVDDPLAAAANVVLGRSQRVHCSTH